MSNIQMKRAYVSIDIEVDVFITVTVFNVYG